MNIEPTNSSAPQANSGQTPQIPGVQPAQPPVQQPQPTNTSMPQQPYAANQYQTIQPQNVAAPGIQQQQQKSPQTMNNAPEGAYPTPQIPTPPATPQQPLAQQNPLMPPDAQNNTTTTYNSNPFVAVGKTLGAGLTYNTVTLLLLTVLPFAFILLLLLLNLGVSIFAPVVSLFFGIAIALFGLLLVFRIWAANTVTLLESVEGKPLSTRRAMGERSKPMYGSYLATVLLLFIIILLGTLIFIIPGIILATRLSLAPIIVYAENKKAISALKRSVQLTKGHTFEMLGALTAQTIITGNGLISTAAAQSGIVGRYHEIVNLEKASSPKPKTHWMNYVLPAAVLIVGLSWLFFYINTLNSINNSLNEFNATPSGSLQTDFDSTRPDSFNDFQLDDDFDSGDFNFERSTDF